MHGSVRASVISMNCIVLWRGYLLATQHRCRSHHGLYRSRIICTAAEITREGIAYLVLCRARVATQERVGREDHAWCAESTLHSSSFNKCLLQWVQFSRRTKALNGCQRTSANPCS